MEAIRLVGSFFIQSLFGAENFVAGKVFFGVWAEFTNIIINVVISIILLMVGLLIVHALSVFVSRLLRLLKVDVILSFFRVTDFFEKRGFKLSVEEFISWLIRWTGYLAFFVFFLRVLQFDNVILFLIALKNFSLKVVGAALILISGVVLASFIRKIIGAVVQYLRLKNTEWIGTLCYWAILVFSLLFALSEFQVSTQILRMFLITILSLIALAGGIAFGISGKKFADDVMQKVRIGGNTQDASTTAEDSEEYEQE